MFSIARALWPGAAAAATPASWRPVTSPTHENLWSVAMLSPTEGWAVGAQGAILHWDGQSWRAFASPISSTLYAVDVLSPSDAWAVGSFGETLHWDGSAWQSVDTGSGHIEFLRNLDMLSPTEGWAVGGSCLYRWDGKTWSAVYCYYYYPPPKMSGVAAVASDDVWAVGHGYEYGYWLDDYALFYHWDGERVETEVRYSASMSDVSFVASDDGWAVGSVTGRWAGEEWYRYYGAPSGTAISMWSSLRSSTDGWIVGDAGRIHRYDGGQWRSCTAVTDRDLFDVVACGPMDAWAVGEGGAILRFGPTPVNLPLVLTG